jgi:hypothetical protein
MKRKLKSNSEFIFYQTEDWHTRLEVQLVNESVWLSLNQMTELFQRDKSVISKHIKNVFEEGELRADSVVANFATTAADGKTYQVAHYNLDVIISVGYRVKSLRGTQFRIWATQRLREYIVKGFTLDDERLKQGGGKYFDELTARIREIRASAKKLDDFLRVNDREILQGFGKVSTQLAKEKAGREFVRYQEQQRQIEDAGAAEQLAREIKQLENKTKPAKLGKKKK